MELVTRSPEETQALGRLLGQMARPGDLFLLSGPLGSGKTCFIQGVAQGLGVEGDVRSPTFVLVTEHRGGLMLYHIDLYRVDDPQEALDLGLDEYLEGGGVCAVEWAEKARVLFPQEHLWVHLAYLGEEERSIRVIASGPRAAQLVEGLTAAWTTAAGAPQGL